MASHRRKHQQEIAHVAEDQRVEQIAPAIPPRQDWPSSF
jgi:hypothetical protein